MAKASNSGGSVVGIAGGCGELSLEEVLKSYEQPINEEQAWAVCYQCARGLAQSSPGPRARIRDPSSLLLHRDGMVTVVSDPQGAPEVLIFWVSSTRSSQNVKSQIIWGLLPASEFRMSSLILQKMQQEDV
ncbi:PREDICTED: protein spire homolog 2-like [Nanorana parkeri]|uniref:protein spire homolog 2-like n=1 Tax=Nanorana parkeri TaxID=125878 RepID=UPI000854AC1F|nr:PREDICTED: protein spire homolog 2-like [Nanorana parkeri]